MAELSLELAELQGQLEAGIAKYRVPGASIGVMRDGETVFAAAGLLNVQTGVEATQDSVFQIGSITKTFTTTLVMQLADEGRIELDVPVREYLPEFSVADADATSAITVRHLLTHTSGIDGDFFLDTGRGDDCVERYVLACAALPQLHAPGEAFSYCNAGFAILGRLIERLTGLTWDRALRTRLLEPIGARSLVTLPEDALTMRAAAGHIPGKEGQPPRVARLQLLPRSNGPAGATPFATTADLLAFARLHLDGGTAADGRRVISAESVARMQEEQYSFAPVYDPAHWGLGWALFDWGGERLFGHDGGTIGQLSYLRILPSKSIAVALLTNGGLGGLLYRELFDEIFGRLAGVAVPPLPSAAEGFEFDATCYTGTYGRLSTRVEVAAEEGGLVATVTPLKSLLPGAPPQVVHLKPVDERRFVSEASENAPPQLAIFGDFNGDARAMSVMNGSRLNPRRG